MRRTLACLLLTLPLFAACERAGDPPPNVLIVMWDTVRADRCSAYSPDLGTTPHLERLAAAGVVYGNAISPSNRTGPAHASLFTGYPVAVHGVRPGHGRLSDDFETLAESFSRAGYATFVATANSHLAEETNLVQGFDVVRQSWEEPLAGPARSHLESKLIEGDRGTEISRHQLPRRAKAQQAWFKEAGPVLNGALVRWLDGTDRGRPFFAFVNYMEAHYPRVPSEAARRLFLDEAQYARALELDRGLDAQYEFTIGLREFDEQDLEVIRGLYDASLHDLDRALGMLLDDLGSRGRLEDTIVVVVGDHGESMGENHVMGHRFSVHDSLLRVPLVIHDPRRLAPARVERLVTTMDLHATVRELAGVVGPDTRSRVLPRRAEDPPTRSFVVGEAPESEAPWRAGRLYPEVDRTPHLRDRRAIYAEGWKLVDVRGDEPLLLRPAEDLAEKADRSTASPEVALRLREELRAWETDMARLREALGAEAGTADYSDEDLERMKALGYGDR